mgnify:CR=1 FL=1
MKNIDVMNKILRDFEEVNRLTSSLVTLDKFVSRNIVNKKYVKVFNSYRLKFDELVNNNSYCVRVNKSYKNFRSFVLD